MKVRKLPPGFEDLELVLTRLSFSDNFQSVTTTVDIDAGVEISLQNPMNPLIPTSYLITSQKRRTNGTISITPGDAAWTSQFLSLRNDGSANATITIVFMRQ